MKIYIATDHAGYDYKEAIASYVEKDLGYTVADMGAHQNDPNDDYPDFIQLAAQEVSHDPSGSRGIVTVHSLGSPLRSLTQVAKLISKRGRGRLPIKLRPPIVRSKP